MESLRDNVANECMPIFTPPLLPFLDTTFRRRQAEEQAKRNIEQKLAQIRLEEKNLKTEQASAE